LRPLDRDRLNDEFIPNILIVAEMSPAEKDDFVCEAKKCLFVHMT
jgi:hypothetical protein